MCYWYTLVWCWSNTSTTLRLCESTHWVIHFGCLPILVPVSVGINNTYRISLPSLFSFSLLFLLSLKCAWKLWTTPRRRAGCGCALARAAPSSSRPSAPQGNMRFCVFECVCAPACSCVCVCVYARLLECVRFGKSSTIMFSAASYHAMWVCSYARSCLLICACACIILRVCKGKIFGVYFNV